MKRRLSVACLFFIALYLSASADYHYASHSGSNTYPYTSWATAAAIIDSAIYAASPYDTIYIASGDYNQIVYQRAQDTCLTFIGAGMDSSRVWIDRDSTHLWSARNQTVVENIWFQHYKDYACYSAASFGSSIVARNCRFTGRECPYGCSGTTGIIGAGDSTVAENCIFQNIWGALHGPYMTKLVFRNNLVYDSTYIAPFVLGDYWSWAVIENNIIIIKLDNQAADFFNGGEDSLFFRNNYFSDMDHGPVTYELNPLIITNNTGGSVKPGRTYMQMGYLITAWPNDETNATFVNNTISGAKKALIFTSRSGYTSTHLQASYNCFWNDSVDIWSDNWQYIDTSNNIHAYPMFQDPDNDNFHLQAYSPLIDAGDPAILDVDGTRSDIGAYGGPGGSWTIYQDRQPAIPDSLRFTLSGDSLILNWQYNSEADFYRYIINRDTLGGFTPWAGNIVAEPETSVFIDLNWDREHNYYYRIAAYDNQGNLSPYSSELAVINVGIWGEPLDVPYTTYIETNYPNPFNSSTTLSFYVADVGPMPAEIKIEIYDIMGKKILTLVDNKYLPGKYSVGWDGKDQNGRALSSGVYFARISQWDIDLINKPRKLVIVK